MKKFLGSKTANLILGGISILVIIFMISSLGGLELKPAVPFTYAQQTSPASPQGFPVLNGLVCGIVFLVVFLVILFLLLSTDQRKKFLKALAWITLAGFIFFLIISRINLGEEIQPSENLSEIVTNLELMPTYTPGPEVAPAVFTPPQVPSWTSYIVALVLLLAVAGIWWWLVLRKRRLAVPYHTIAEIAKSALDDIEAGRDWGDTILNSYYRMNITVADWRGIQRQVGMTPSEFADYLVSTYIPRDAVNRLTRLFERARYGNKKPTRNDINEAVDCLTAILEYCRGAE